MTVAPSDGEGAVVDPFAVGVEHADGAELGADRLAEDEGDVRRGGVEVGTVSRVGRLELRVRRRRRRPHRQPDEAERARGQDSEQSRGQAGTGVERTGRSAPAAGVADSA